MQYILTFISKLTIIPLKEGYKMFNLFKKKEDNQYLLEWQNAILKDKSDKLVMNKKQLIQATSQQAQRYIEIANDCVKIVNDTVNPNTFFDRLELLEDTSKKLVSLEKYLDFTGAKPSQSFQEFNEQKQTAIYNFVIRYLNSILDKSEKLKTQRGKNNQIQKFYDSLVPYFDLMNEYNKKYIITKYETFLNTQ